MNTNTSSTPPQLEILIYGLGAIGSFYAFILSRNPHVRLTVVARSNYTAVASHGIHIKSENHGEHVFHPAAVLRSPHEAGHTFDFIVCANKATDPAATVSELAEARVVDEARTTIAIMQNGVGNEEPFHARWPGCTILSGVIWVAATQESPGVIRQSVSESTTIGIFANDHVEMARQEAALERFTGLLKGGGTPFIVDKSIQTPRWKKCIWNAAWNSLNTLSGVDTHAWLKSSEFAMQTTQRLMGEAVQVAVAVEVPGIEMGLVDELIGIMLGFSDTVRTSMYYDSVAGRAMEVEVIVGNIVKKGRECDVEIPTLETLYALLLALDQRLERERKERGMVQ